MEIENLTQNKISTLEFDEESHKMPEVSIKYRYNNYDNTLQIFLNNHVVSTFTDEYASLVWLKLNQREKKITNNLTKEIIISIACEATGISISEIYLHERKRKIVVARQLAMATIFKYLYDEPSRIGRIFGTFTHATVIYAVKEMEKELKHYRPNERIWISSFYEKLSKITF